MSNELELHGERITVRVQTGRRGVDVEVAGALTLALGTAWDDPSLLLALLDAKGAVLTIDRSGLRFEEASGQRLLFSEALRLPDSLAERLAVVEVWAAAAVIELTDIGTFSIASDLPVPRPGHVSFHTVRGATLKLNSPNDDGEARLTVFGRCAFEGNSAYSSHGEVRVCIVDAEDRVLYAGDSGFETMNGQKGAASFDVRFRPHVEQLRTAHHMDVSIVTKRFVASDRVGVSREASTVVDDR